MDKTQQALGVILY